MTLASDVFSGDKMVCLYYAKIHKRVSERNFLKFTNLKISQTRYFIFSLSSLKDNVFERSKRFDIYIFFLQMSLLFIVWSNSHNLSGLFLDFDITS